MANQKKLTNRDLSEIFYMVLEGFTFKDAAEKYMVCESAISYRFKRAGVRFELKHMNCIPSYYPNIRKWMIENRVSERRFANMTGICQSTISFILNGKKRPSMASINKVLKATGMTFEEAFATEETDVREES